MKLSEDIRMCRAGRPDEWTMDRWVMLAQNLEQQNAELLLDKQRLDFMDSLPTCQITKGFSLQGGASWPWVFGIVNRRKSPEFKKIRDAIDWCGGYKQEAKGGE